MKRIKAVSISRDFTAQEIYNNSSSDGYKSSFLETRQILEAINNVKNNDLLLEALVKEEVEY